MASTIFQKILQDAIDNGQLFRADTKDERDEAREWLEEKTKKLSRKTTPNKILGDKEQLRRRIQTGRLYFFKYDPKGKKTLPFYDTFPLTLPIETFSGGFLGLNFHYLPLNIRAKLMDALFTLQNNDDFDETTRMIVTYKILKSAIKFRSFRPALKKYLNKHVKSRFLRIEANEWEVAIFLPVERFRKASKIEVWDDTRKQLRRR